jgi:hypothetical protein
MEHYAGFLLDISRELRWHVETERSIAKEHFQVLGAVAGLGLGASSHDRTAPMAVKSGSRPMVRSLVDLRAGTGMAQS